jgi:antibiotic biosynthesis monooxygenase (ABM) superfamily enzyme
MSATTTDLEQGSTTAITHRVQAAKVGDYEAWLQRIIPMAKSYPGHLGVQVIRPVGNDNSTYTVLLRFDTEEHALGWMRSQDRARLLEELKPILEDDEKFTVKSGLDFWFTPEEVRAKVPVRWKQFLITWSAIFPLVALIPLVLNPFLDALGVPANRYLRALALTFCVVALVVYVVMPRYTKLVHKWLFK